MVRIATALGLLLALGGLSIACNTTAGGTEEASSRLLAEAGQPISLGMSGSWFYPETPGQGFLIDVVPAFQPPALVGYWFTYSRDSGEQRWFLADGRYTRGSPAVLLDVYKHSGGRFDHHAPEPDQHQIGDAVLQFHDCHHATLHYALQLDGDDEISEGVIPLERLSPDALCAETEVDATFRRALSVSPFAPMMLDAGIVFEDEQGQLAETLEELQALFVEHGANEVFARAATRRQSSEDGVDRSKQAVKQRAQVAEALNLPLNVELGLYRSYGDVLCQTPPDFSDYPEIESDTPWHELDIDSMTDKLGRYAELAAEDILATGAEVSIWNLGNEVDFGTAGVAPQPAPGACDGDEGESGWYRAPDGVDPEIGRQSVGELMAGMSETERIGWLENHVWPHTARLLAAAATGVRRVDPYARFATHISTSHSEQFAVAFYQSLDEHGFRPDELGLSLYPSAHEQSDDRFDTFTATVERLQSEFEQPVFIAEYAYPATAPTDGPFQAWHHHIEGYPISPEGQARLLRDLVRWAGAHELAGIRLWAPDLVTAGWESFALFEVDGNQRAKARPALRALLDGLARPDPEALKRGTGD